MASEYQPGRSIVEFSLVIRDPLGDERIELEGILIGGCWVGFILELDRWGRTVAPIGEGFDKYPIGFDLVGRISGFHPKLLGAEDWMRDDGRVEGILRDGGGVVEVIVGWVWIEIGMEDRMRLESGGCEFEGRVEVVVGRWVGIDELPGRGG